MEHISSPNNSNLLNFADFLEGGDGTDLRSPDMADDGGHEQDSDFLGEHQQQSRQSVGGRSGQNVMAANHGQGSHQVRSMQSAAAGNRAAASRGLGSRSNNQKASLPTSQIKNSSKILIADGAMHQLAQQQNQTINRSHLIQQQQQIQKFERPQNLPSYQGNDQGRLTSSSNSPTNPSQMQASRQQRASSKKIGGGAKHGNMNGSSNIVIEQNQVHQQAQLSSAGGMVQQMSGTGVPHYGGPLSSMQPGAGGLLSTTSKKQGAGTEATNSIIGDQGTSAGGSNGHGGGAGQGQNQVGGSQYRNSKNRKLYTSIGAYNSAQPGQQPQMAQHLGSGAGAAIVQVPLINFASNGVHQRNVPVSQQNSVTSTNQAGPPLLSHQISLSQGNQHKATGLKNDPKGKGLSGGKDRGAKAGAGPKNGKKLGNSSVLVVQPRELHTAQNITNNSLVGIEPMTMSVHGGAEHMSHLQPHQQLSSNQLAYAQAQAYQSMINNNDANNGTTNVNDISVLSGASQSINFAQRQNLAGINGSGHTGSVTSSVIIERAGGPHNNGKKGKKATNSKNPGQPETSWSGGPGGGRAPAGGIPSQNFTKVGNFVGSGNSQLEQSFSEQQAHGSGVPPKTATKKVTSKMVPAGTHSKAAQHQQFLQNQIHFMNNFSVDESVTSMTGPQGHGNGAHQQFIVLKANGNVGNGSSSNAQVMAQQPKQRPHSSFKAQTQKQIHTYKQQLINIGGGAVGAGNAPAPAAGGSANARGQLLLMGANGVVGIGGGSTGSKIAGGVANVASKTVGSRKNKHLTHQVNVGKSKYGLGGNTQQLNSMSVYQSDLVTEPNSRESRRMGRGSSGIGASGVQAIELSNITKEHREMRTSSATAGNTNTEFKLLSMTGLSGQGNTGPNGLLNFSNHNQHYMLGGGTSATHALSGASGISGLSGGAVSAHTAGGGFGSKAQTGSLMFNLTAGNQTNQKQPVKSNKLSKRNIAANANLNFNFQGGNILSSTAMSLNNNQKEQIAALTSKNNDKLQSSKFEKIDSMRSGDGGREGGRGSKPSKSIPGAHQANQAMSGAGGYGLSMFPANKYDQQQQQQMAAKASKASTNNGALPPNGENQSTQNQIQKSHQQSMQKFLQQQMTHYNTGNQSSQKTKKTGGLKSTSKTSNAVVSHYQQLPQGQGQIQGGQGQGQGQGAAGMGYGEGVYANKQAQQKLTKKQIQQQNLLASDRLREAQRGGDSGGAARKAGTQTAIGTGAKRTVLNSSQIQISNQGQRQQAQSLSRSRGASHAGKGQQISTVSATAVTRIAPGGGASSVIGGSYGKRGGVQALSSISGAHGALGPMAQLGAISGTPGIQGNSKIALIGNSASNQRNFNSNVQNTNNSNQLPRQDTYNSSSRRNKRGGTATISSGGGAGGLMGAGSGVGSGYANRVNVKRGTGANTQHGGPDGGAELGAFDLDGQPAYLQYGPGQRSQQQASFDASQMHYQIQIAEQALRDMRMSLNRPRVMGPGGVDFGGQQQFARPKSQNDAQNYFLSAPELAHAAEAAEAMSLESKGIDTGHEVLSGQSRALAAIRDHRDRDRASPRAPILSQDRVKDRNRDRMFDERDDQNQMRERNYIEQEEELKLDQTQDMNSTFIEQHQSKMNDGPVEAIDKDQFIEIISCAFDKIINSLHPRVGGSLDQIRSMYDLYLEQVDLAHQQELQQNAIQIQDVQSCVTELQVVNQQLRMQLGQNQQSSDQKSIQLNDFVTQNEDLLSQLKKHVKDNKLMKMQMAKLQEKYNKQTNQLNHLKNNIEQHRGTQQENSSNAVDAVAISKNVIQQMKESKIGVAGGDEKAGRAHGNITRDLDVLEKRRRAERNERVVESSEDPGDQMAFDENDDPLCLDGDIVIGQNNQLGAGRRNFDESHVRISNGEVVEQRNREGARHQEDGRRRMDDLSDELSSIPSYDMGPGRGSGGRAAAGGKQMVHDGLDLDAEVEDLMIFDERGDIDDLKDLDINDNDRRGSRSDNGRNGEGADGEGRDQQSYFSSQQSESMDSDMVAALQHAIDKNGGHPPEGLDLLRQGMPAGAHEGQAMDMLMFQKSSNRPCPQDKSPIKVPALNLMQMQDQEEGEMGMQPEEAEPDYGTENQDDLSQSDLGLIADFMPPLGLQGGNMPGQPKFPGLALGGLNLGGLGGQDASGGMGPPGVGFGLDLSQLKAPNNVEAEVPQAQDFQDEFLLGMDQFSESWRQALRKEKRF